MATTSTASPGGGNKTQGPVVCVFCGSSGGTDPAHLESAEQIGKALYKHGVSKLVYGGGTTGMMGKVAETFSELAGPEKIHGVIPGTLQSYESQTSSTFDKYGRRTIVKSMHERKKLMASEVMQGGPGSGFIALSGGYGTAEEWMEMTTWNQLGIHDKPVVLFNVKGFYEPMRQWVEAAGDAGFISQTNTKIVEFANDAEGVMKALEEYKPSKGRFNLDWNAI